MMIREHFIPMGRPTLRVSTGTNPFFRSQPAASNLQALSALAAALLVFVKLGLIVWKKIVQKDWKAAFMIEKTSRDIKVLSDQIRKSFLTRIEKKNQITRSVVAKYVFSKYLERQYKAREINICYMK